MDFAGIWIHLLFEIYPLIQMGDTKDDRSSGWAHNISGTADTPVRRCVAVNTCPVTVPGFPGKSRFRIIFLCPTRAHMLLRLCIFNFGLENMVLRVSGLGGSQ